MLKKTYAIVVPGAGEYPVALTDLPGDTDSEVFEYGLRQILADAKADVINKAFAFHHDEAAVKASTVDSRKAWAAAHEAEVRAYADVLVSKRLATLKDGTWASGSRANAEPPLERAIRRILEAAKNSTFPAVRGSSTKVGWSKLSKDRQSEVIADIRDGKGGEGAKQVKRDAEAMVAKQAKLNEKADLGIE